MYIRVYGPELGAACPMPCTRSPVHTKGTLDIGKPSICALPTPEGTASSGWSLSTGPLTFAETHLCVLEAHCSLSSKQAAQPGCRDCHIKMRAVAGSVPPGLLLNGGMTTNLGGRGGRRYLILPLPPHQDCKPIFLDSLQPRTCRSSNVVSGIAGITLAYVGF